MATFLERKREAREASPGQQGSVEKELVESLKAQWASDDEQGEAQRAESYRQALESEELRKTSTYSLCVELSASNELDKLVQAVVGFESIIDLNDSRELAAACREKIDAILVEQNQKAADEIKALRKKYKLCQRCGNKLGKAKVCPNCGEPRDN